MSIHNAAIDASNVRSEVSRIKARIASGVQPSDEVVHLCDSLIDLASALGNLCDALSRQLD